MKIEYAGKTMSLKLVATASFLQITMGLKRTKCYWNCLKVLEEAEYNDACYVEGIAVKPKKSIHAHGWIEIDGEILDPTCPTDELYYYRSLNFHGIETIRQEIAKVPRDCDCQDDLPIYKLYGRNGERSRLFRSALELAIRDFGDSTPFDPAEEL